MLYSNTLCQGEIKIVHGHKRGEKVCFPLFLVVMGVEEFFCHREYERLNEALGVKGLPEELKEKVKEFVERMRRGGEKRREGLRKRLGKYDGALDGILRALGDRVGVIEMGAIRALSTLLKECQQECQERRMSGNAIVRKIKSDARFSCSQKGHWPKPDLLKMGELDDLMRQSPTESVIDGPLLPDIPVREANEGLVTLRRDSMTEGVMSDGYGRLLTEAQDAWSILASGAMLSPLGEFTGQESDVGLRGFLEEVFQRVVSINLFLESSGMNGVAYPELSVEAARQVNNVVQELEGGEEKERALKSLAEELKKTHQNYAQ